MSNNFLDKDGNVVGPMDFNFTLGRKAAASARSFALSNEDNATIGALTETAPASDTASSGLNGRLQRIAQRLSSLIALLPASLGIKTAANSLSITHASDDAVVAATGTIGDTAWSSGNGTAIALLKAIAGNSVSTTPSPVQARNPDYETVAASATDQIMGASGAVGDYLSHLIITPATTSPGNVIIKDGSTTIFTFTGGSSSVTTLIPFMVPLGLVAATAWKITTGTNVSAIAVGDFS